MIQVETQPKSQSFISSVTKWKEFFDRYYKEELRLLAVQDGQSISIDYKLIQKYDIRLSHELIENPDLCLSHAEESLTLIDLPIKKVLQLRVRPFNFPKHLRIREIRNSNVNKLVSVEATVQNISVVNDRCVEAAFECARCKNISVIPQEGGGKFIEPSYCSCNEERKGVFRILYKESRFENYQKLRVQESPEDLKGDEQPRTMDLNVADDLADYTRPGERVTVNGIMRSAQRIKNNMKTAFFDYYIDAVSIEREEVAYEDLEITAEDIIEIKKLANGIDPVEHVTTCIAPWIYGLVDIKRGLVGLLFGGVGKTLPDGAKIRGDIHCLWVGDPGVAKSQILLDVSKLAPRGMYTSGLGVSAAGLTAATVRDDFMGDGSFSLRAGVLALMNGGGIACIDEFGRMKDEDREKMHSAMEDQIIPIDRAGFHTTLHSKCSVLAAGNPIKGRWDDYKNPGEQIGIEAALLSRFDIIFVTRDISNITQDRIVSNHILLMNHAGEMLANKKECDITKLSRPISTDMLRKWIAYARRTCNPIIEKDGAAWKMLEDYYLEIRGQNGKTDIIHATARQLVGPIRMAEAFARVRLSPTVSVGDVTIALNILRDSMNSIKDPVTGKIDYSTVNTGEGTSQVERRRNIRKTIIQISKDTSSKLVSTYEVIKLCKQDYNMEDKAVLGEIEAMKDNKDLTESDGYVELLK